jgi:hypothetical protein
LTPEETSGLFTDGYTTKGPGRGTGLGLIRGLVQSSQGEFSVESEKGVGTSMILTFTKPRHFLSSRGETKNAPGEDSSADEATNEAAPNDASEIASGADAVADAPTPQPRRLRPPEKAVRVASDFDASS